MPDASRAQGQSGPSASAPLPDTSLRGLCARHSSSLGGSLVFFYHAAKPSHFKLSSHKLGEYSLRTCCHERTGSPSSERCQGRRSFIPPLSVAVRTSRSHGLPGRERMSRRCLRPRHPQWAGFREVVTGTSSPHTHPTCHAPSLSILGSDASPVSSSPKCFACLVRALRGWAATAGGTAAHGAGRSARREPDGGVGGAVSSSVSPMPFSTQ